VISILYIDDEPDLLEIAKLFLEQKKDIRVDTGVSAIEAVKNLKQNPRSHDVVISDYMMPELDGISFLKKIRELDSTLPFIIFTGRGREDIVIEALNNGADFYLQKGGDPTSQFVELEHKVRVAVERRSAKERIVSLNRLYAVLSQINLAIVRIRKQDELLSEVCRIAVSTGKFHPAWIGMIDYQHMVLRVVADEGVREDSPKTIAFFSSNNQQEYCQGLQTILEGRYFICKNIQDYPPASVLRTDAEKYGYHAFGAFPLKFHDKVIGAFLVYAADPELFSAEETELLNEVASDISFALESIDEENHRILAESALRDSEHRYRIFIDSMDDMVFLKDNKFRYIVINNALEKYFGTSEDKIIGKTDFDLMPVPLAEQCLDSDKRTLETGHSISTLEFNEKKVYETHKFPVNVQNDLTYIGGYIRDITSQKNAEQSLKDSELKYRIVANNTYDWELWWSPTDNYLYVSPSVKRVTGHAPEEFVKDPDLLWRIIHPDDRHEFQKHQQGVVDTKEPGEVEFRIILPDGSMRWIDHVCEPVYNDEGKYLGHRACNRDITDRKDMEEKLYRLNQIQMSLIQNAHLWLMILDEKGNVQVWNTGAELISGFLGTEAIGNMDLWKHLYPDKGYRAFVTTRIREIIEKNDYFENLETTIHTKSGEIRYLLWNTQKLTGSKGETVSYISVGRDITSSRVAQKTIESLERFMYNNPDPVLKINNEGIVLDANKSSQPLLAAWSCSVGSRVPEEIMNQVREVLDTLLPKMVTINLNKIIYALDLFPNREESYVTIYGRVCIAPCIP
jgi:PAS domain S-box-containing protein